jgi:sugar phosphate isomerase/epimerase
MLEPTRRRFLKTAAGVVAGWPALAGVSRAAPEPAKAFSPRLAICNETFGEWPLEKALALAAECGYQGVEIAPFTIAENVNDITPKRRREIRGLAEENGLEVVGLHWLLAKTKGLHLTSPDDAVRRKTREYLAALTRFCADLGGRVLVFGSPKQRDLLPGVTRQQALGHAAEVFRSLAQVLERSGVVLALEPLAPKTTTFLTTSAEAVELMKLVDSPTCRLHLDCLAMSTEPTPIPELIERNRASVVHFHANDPNQQGPGFGKLDFVPIFQALRRIDYSGWVSVEVFDYTPGPERLARQSIAYMKKCLADVQ